jgi:hypothetical protein
VAGGVMYVSAALKSASVILIPNTIVDRISFFIMSRQVYHAGFHQNFSTYMYLPVLLKYNARVAVGQGAAINLRRMI